MLEEKMNELDEQTKKKIEQLQLLEQNVSALIQQRQQFQSQLMEVESALKELETTEHAYKIIGNVMVLSEKPQLIEDLNSKKEVLELRIKSIEKQEKNSRQKATDIQQEVLKKMKD